jgi:hypothetical protein
MRGARFDQYKFPGFRSILGSLLLWCVATLAGLGSCVLTVVTLDDPPTAPLSIFQNVIYFLFLIMLFIGAMYLLVKKNKEYIASYQARRDEAARILLNAVISGEHPKFAVFLRPFYTTDKIKSIQRIMMPIYNYASTAPTFGSSSATTFGSSLAPTFGSASAPALGSPSAPTFGSPPTVTYQSIPVEHKLEQMIMEAFCYTMPVVALGKPGETFGIGRILVDEGSWKTAASKLMRDASLIICLPSARSGSDWELHQIIRNNYFGKTVFLMPPDQSSWRGWKQLREDWDLVEQHMAADGIRIPKYEKNGLLFSVDAKRQSITEKLRLDSSPELLKAITGLSSNASIPATISPPSGS